MSPEARTREQRTIALGAVFVALGAALLSTDVTWVAAVLLMLAGASMWVQALLARRRGGGGADGAGP